MALRNSPTVIATEPFGDVTDPIALKRGLDQLRLRVSQLSTTTTETTVISPYVTTDYRIRVKAIARSNVVLSGIPAASAFDDVTIAAGDPVFISNNTDPRENGTYLAGSWERIVLTAGANASGAQVVVNQGTLWANTRWSCTSLIGADTVGTNNLTWARDSELLPDLAFDANDVFAYLYNETVGVALSSVNSQVGAAQTLTTYAAAVPTAFPANYTVPGPFGGAGLWIFYGYGLAGASNGAVVPATYTLSFWFYPELMSNIAFTANKLLMITRTNTNSPTGAAGTVPTQYDLTIGTAANTTAGTSQDFYRNLEIFSRHGGGTETFLGSFVNRGQLLVQRWNHIALVRRSGSPFATEVYINGMPTGQFATTTPVGTAAGRWGICNPGTATGVGTNFGSEGRYARVRLSNVARADTWIKEQAQRGLSWLA